MTSSSPAGLEGSDLSSINTMMSAVMSVGKVAENGGSPQNVKSPSKPPGPNRIGRRNQETKEERSSYNCPLCEKICTTQHQLTMHIRQHNTDTGGADHSCSICGKSLSSASSLDRHMLVHSGERPYKCTVCGQSFTTNGNMHRHMKIHEKDPNSSTAATPPSPLKRRRLSSKRKLSHDAESEKEDPAPAKKVSTPGLSAELPSLYFHSPGAWQTAAQAPKLCFCPLFAEVSGETPTGASSVEPLAEPTAHGKSSLRCSRAFWFLQLERALAKQRGPSHALFHAQCLPGGHQGCRGCSLNGGAGRGWWRTGSRVTRTRRATKCFTARSASRSSCASTGWRPTWRPTRRTR